LIAGPNLFSQVMDADAGASRFVKVTDPRTGPDPAPDAVKARSIPDTKQSVRYHPRQRAKPMRGR